MTLRSMLSKAAGLIGLIYYCLQVYSLSNKLAPRIDYQYVVPDDLANDVTLNLHALTYRYMWRYMGWSECTSTCDGGECYTCVPSL